MALVVIFITLNRDYAEDVGQFIVTHPMVSNGGCR